MFQESGRNTQDAGRRTQDNMACAQTLAPKVKRQRPAPPTGAGEVAAARSTSRASSAEARTNCGSCSSRSHQCIPRLFSRSIQDFMGMVKSLGANVGV
jgi:hypothetical protein